ncbi:MAG: deoxyUTP pyrophosphatase [Anaerocolumna sp.]|jgi:dUTP pyrophosphatase|nr:deoxyUTP pyrophosphatase [Anaerocolumna sp.]
MTLKENELLFAKVRDGAIIPSKREEDGCFDIYACFNEEYMVIPPHTNKLIPTGIASAFTPKYRLAIRERGSNTKSTLITMAGQVDSGYRGEIFVSLYNGNDIHIEITKNIIEVEKTEDLIRVPYTKAIAQFAIEEVPVMNVKEISYEYLVKIESERGIGKLGSSTK